MNDQENSNFRPKSVVLVSAAALIDSEGKILLAQRPAGRPMAGLWEFPGGKVEAGETPEDALARELAEELSIRISTVDLRPFTFASHTYDEFHLLMPLYEIRRWQGTVAPAEGQDVAWVSANELEAYPMPPADVPLIPALKALVERVSP